MIGVLSGRAFRRAARPFWDRSATTVALFFYSMPTFVLGLILLWIFYYQFTIHGLHWFPGQGYTYFTQSPLDWFRGLVLPWFTLALVSAAAYTRLTRGSLLEVMGEDYIRTARSKGLTERRVIYRHGLRSALTPVVSQFGIDLGVLLGGAIITEQVFGHAGARLDCGECHRITGPAGDHRDRDRRLSAVVVSQHPGRRGLRRARPSGAPALAPFGAVIARGVAPTLARPAGTSHPCRAIVQGDHSGLVSEP